MNAKAILLLAVLHLMLGSVAQAQTFIFDLQTAPELPTSDQPTDFLAYFISCPSTLVENIDGEPYDLRVNGFEVDFFIRSISVSPAASRPRHF